MKATLLITGLFLVGLISSCEKKNGIICYNGNNNLITEERSTSSFNAIQLSIGAEINITQSPIYTVKITTSENLMKLIKTDVSGNTLYIGMKKKTCIRKQNDIKIAITLPQLKKIDISGSGDVTVRGKIVTDDLDIQISGSGNVEMDSLYASSCSVSISGSGNVTLAGSEIINNQTIKISGSGNINMFDLPAKKIDAKISGSGDIRIHCLDELIAKISGSGDIIYKGNPLISVSNSGSGSIKPY